MKRENRENIFFLKERNKKKTKKKRKEDRKKREKEKKKKGKKDQGFLIFSSINFLSRHKL